MAMNERFKKVLKSTGMSKDKLADILGVSSRTLKRIEAGEVSTVSIEMLATLRQQFNIDLNALFSKEYNNDDRSVHHQANDNSIKYGSIPDRFAKHLEEENKWLKEQNEKLLNMIANKGADEKTQVRNSG
jgi:transcriptional regulator with XRE-family HTH domain